MSFSSRPDRSKVSRSPVAKKSPCQSIPRQQQQQLHLLQQEPAAARKCSSPIFTSSPTRPPVKASVRTLLKSPEHAHKENATLPPPSPVSKIPKPWTMRASPKRILGENSFEPTRGTMKKSRKEWQIPTPSTLELKESLSESSFVVNSELLEEPRPVSNWIQDRSGTYACGEEVVSKPRDASPAISQHSFAGSSTVDSMEEHEEHSSKLRESPENEHASPEVETKVESKLEIVEEMINVEVLSNEEVVEGMINVEVLSNEEVVEEMINVEEVREVSKIEVVEDMINVEEVREVSKIEVVEKKFNVELVQEQAHPRSLFKSLLLLGSLVLLSSFIIFFATRVSPGDLKWDHLTITGFSEGIEWSSESDLLAFYVDPGQLKMHAENLKLELSGLFEKSRVVFQKAFKNYKRELEDLGLKSISFAGSYYSSLILQNHARDVVFNYCGKVQGEYHRLRFALASLTEQSVPLENAARAMAMNFEGAAEKLGRWLAAAEKLAYEGLVLNFLGLEDQSQAPADAEEVDLPGDAEEAHHLPGDEEVHLPGVAEEVHHLPAEAEGVHLPGDAEEVHHLPADAEEVHLPDEAEEVHHLPADAGELHLPAEAEEVHHLPAVAGEVDHLPAEHSSGMMESPAPEEDASESFLDDDSTPEKVFELIPNLKLFLASTLGFIAAYLAYQLLSSSSTKPKSSTPGEISTPEKMKMRGADEDLILTPEQKSGDYSPYGSFTAYKQVVFNEGSGNKIVKVTPVRRSSRIRNQVHQVQSPQLK